MPDRKLPSKRNPHLGPIDDEDLKSDLISKRRLGQTELAVSPGQVGTSNATSPKNLGVFDYAHIRVPLPKDLKGSGMFHATRGHSTPEAYFLMRRSSDGYISATGMFKVAFPWASQADEEVEKKHLKSIEGAGREEIAGNIWIPPAQALDLADDYNMRDWLIVLLDPQPMAKGTHDPTKDIQPPPAFKVPTTKSRRKKEASVDPESITNGASLPPPSEGTSTRKRNLRSASPVKSSHPPPATPSRKIATPTRKARGRPPKGGLSTTAEEAVNGDAAPSGNDTIKVDIETTVEPTASGVEETKTHVTVETPANHPQLDLPNDAQAFLDQASAAIREANKLTAGRAAGRKRKARDVELEDEALDAILAETADPDAAGSSATQLEIQPAKRVRMTELELRKEKIKRRATLGIAASLAVGTLVPVIMNTFFQSL